MIFGIIISDMECPWQPPAALASPAAAILPSHPGRALVAILYYYMY